MFSTIQTPSQTSTPIIALILLLGFFSYLMLVYGFRFRLVNHQFCEEKLIFYYFFFIKSELRYVDIETMSTPSYSQFFFSALNFTKTRFTAVEMPFLKIVCLKSRTGMFYYFTPPYPDRFILEIRTRCQI